MIEILLANDITSKYTAHAVYVTTASLAVWQKSHLIIRQRGLLNIKGLHSSNSCQMTYVFFTYPVLIANVANPS